MLKVYAYKNCTTCRKALRWLEQNGITPEVLAIRETPPTKAELAAVLAAHDGEVRLLFNRSGQDYRALGLKDTLPAMQEAEALDLLAGNANLVKRPFAIDSKAGTHLVGFDEAKWSAALG